MIVTMKRLYHGLPASSTPHRPVDSHSHPPLSSLSPGSFRDRENEFSYTMNSTLLERAFLVGTDPGFNGRIRKSLYNEFGGFWRWTLNAHFDISLAGNVAIPDGGYRDLGRLADCNPGGVRQGCNSDDVALSGEARFRARF
jgi:hypothetical protein